MEGNRNLRCVAAIKHSIDKATMPRGLKASRYGCAGVLGGDYPIMLLKAQWRDLSIMKSLLGF